MTTNTPNNLGARYGRLYPCPKSPNCVCSQSGNPDRFIKPFQYPIPGVEAFAHLQSILRRYKNATFITATDVYLHLEFRSSLFRFVDDVEFLMDDKSRVIHVRSAARKGFYDFGANRNRVEAIRKEFYAIVAPEGSATPRR